LSSFVPSEDCFSAPRFSAAEVRPEQASDSIHAKDNANASENAQRELMFMTPKEDGG
jgi:hypothetical protein